MNSSNSGTIPVGTEVKKYIVFTVSTTTNNSKQNILQTIIFQILTLQNKVRFVKK